MGRRERSIAVLIVYKIFTIWGLPHWEKAFCFHTERKPFVFAVQLKTEIVDATKGVF